MIHIKKIILLIGWFVIIVTPVYAQSNTVEIGSIIESTISGDGVQTYQLTALETSIISIRAEALDASFDPIIQISDSSGNVIISNDDYDYPNSRDAIIQALVIPRTGTYNIQVSGFGDTSGDYRLSILPGYDTLIVNDVATSQDNWQSSNNNLMSTTPIDDRLRVEIEGISSTNNLIATDLPTGIDYYYAVTFADISASTNWQVGIVFRYINPTLFYRLILNDQGFWQLEWVNGEDITIVQSWSTHPGIVAGATEFTIGVLISGTKFDIVYNDQLIATVYDANINQPGNVGVTAITANAVGSRVAFSIKKITMTTPTLVNNQLSFPELLVASNYTSLAHTLERQKVIPVGGGIKLTAPQSVIRNVDPGVSRFSVASGIEFSEFVMGGTLSWDIIGEGIGGCGITFNTIDDTNYTLAYINIAGEYGISKREGDSFTEGIYASDLVTANRPSHNFILIVYNNIIHYYINNQHVGTMSYTPVLGEVRTAVVNFDGVDTTCTIDNLWLWSLDNLSS